MKKLVLAVAAFALSTVAVTAQPLTPMPVANWTGFYAGFNGGMGGTSGTSMHFNDLAQNAYVPVNIDPSGSGVLGGFHLGYNWQFSGNWLFGVEGDWDATGIRSGDTQRLTCAGPSRPQCGGVAVLFTDFTALQTDVKQLASLRGRVGYAVDQNLFYFTGGVAWGDFKFNAAVNCTAVQPSFCNPISQTLNTQFSDTRVGFVIGGGMERRLAANWSIGAEYLYYRFNDTSTAGGNFFFSNGNPAPFFECSTAGQNCAKFTFGDIGISTGRVRLTYQFTP